MQPGILFAPQVKGCGIMSKIWYLIPSDLMVEVTENLDRAGVCFHVADQADLAEAISKIIIAFDGKEFVPKGGDTI